MMNKNLKVDKKVSEQEWLLEDGASFDPRPLSKGYTVLGKSYRGSGRPQSFMMVESSDTEEIDRLCEGHQYFIVKKGVSKDYDPWKELTIVAPSGFTNWK